MATIKIQLTGSVILILGYILFEAYSIGLNEERNTIKSEKRFSCPNSMNYNNVDFSVAIVNRTTVVIDSSLRTIQADIFIGIEIDQLDCNTLPNHIIK